MISIIRNSFRSSPARSEMKALGINEGGVSLVGVGIAVLAIADVLPASVAPVGA